ncbi:histidine kinase [Actinomycetospora lutea]|uniref:sensor histidine kinase n=1 Tax=Actinomycetospora lutea TaxID=663604 RepID=UPI00236511E0|nr:histidine kinase [Actinomycetospora lutea]MDD7937428.1 histidine kinase [Actinomycetospora lutea]
MDVRSWRPAGTDVALAAALGAFCVAGTALAATPTDRPWWPGGALLIAAAALVLAGRRRAPLVVLALTLASVAPYYWLAYPDGPASLMVAVAMYTVATRLSWPRSLGVGVLLFVVWVGLERVIDGRPVASAPEHVMWIVVTVAIGVAVGGLRRAQTAAVEQAQEQARRRVEQERLRVAREVHDVVSHSLAMIAVQAGVGAHVADRRPEQAVAALLEIKQASSAALAELRNVLGVLRDAEPAGTPGLHRLDEVVRVAGLAGVDVEVRGSPEVVGRPAPAVDGAAFRIVREAVTNAVRHARRGHRVVVELAPSADELRVRVADDGGPTDALTPGHGLRGLDEHAAAVGGRCAVTATPVGVVVEAWLPVGGARTPVGAP